MSNEIIRTIKIADINPRELAAVFCGMWAGEQAEFFSEIARITADWPGAGWCQQCCGISEHLDKAATEAIAKLAEWAAEPYVSPAKSKGGAA